jgi:hypothetical protein
MKNRMNRIWLLSVLLLVLVSCAGQKKSAEPYYENLSDVRPRVAPPMEDTSLTQTVTKEIPETTVVPFTKTVNEKVDAVLDSIDRFNLIKRSVDGHTIQIYSGQNREDAMNAKKKISTDLPDLTATLQYQQPKFRVTVGKYLSKLEAYQDLVRIRRSFPSAILVPEKIAIR